LSERCDDLQARMLDALRREREARSLLISARANQLSQATQQELRQGLNEIRNERQGVERTYTAQCRVLAETEVSRLEAERLAAQERMIERRRREPPEMGIPVLTEEEREIGERARRVGPADRERRP
jgi:hypothetical protein